MINQSRDFIFAAAQKKLPIIKEMCSKDQIGAIGEVYWRNS